MLIESHKDISIPSLCKPGDLYGDRILFFNSIQDFIDTSLSAAQWPLLAMSGRDESWYAFPEETLGMPFKERAMDYINGGYGTNNDLIHAYGLPQDSYLGEIVPGMAGGAVNVPLYLSGDPACMMAPQIQEKPVDSLAITVLTGMSAATNGYQALKRAAAIASYIPYLLNQGISVYLYSYSMLQDDDYNWHLAVIKLFDTSQPYDAAEVFLGCGSPVMSRIVKFSYTDWLCREYGWPREWKFGGYGRSASFGGGSINKDGSYDIFERVGMRFESLLPTTHCVHMPDIGQGTERDMQWHFDFVQDNIRKYLGDQGMVI